MNSKVKFIVGLVLFIVAFLLPLVAMWRYTGFGLKMNSFLISATVFYASIIVAIVLFYIQWKICPDTWIYVRQWFSDHAWSFFLGITILIICHSLLFFRFYNRQGHRYLVLKSKLIEVKWDVDEIGTIKESIEKVQGAINDLSESVDKLKRSIDTSGGNRERTVPEKKPRWNW